MNSLILKIEMKNFLIKVFNISEKFSKHDNLTLADNIIRVFTTSSGVVKAAAVPPDKLPQIAASHGSI